MSWSRLTSACAPAPTPMTAIRPPVAERAQVVRDVRCADELEHDVVGAAVGERVRSADVDDAARASDLGDGRAELLVAHRRDHARAGASGELHGRDRRRHPRRRAPAHARPSVSSHCVKSASCAVVNTSGNPPASDQPSPSGTGSATRSWTHARSAWPPPPTTAITASPTANRDVAGPVAITSPASSSPGMSAGASGGAAYRPRRCSMSAPLMPAARTSIEQLSVTGLRIGVLAPRQMTVGMVTACTGRQ